MIKREELGQLEQEMERDSLLPLESNLVFGEGDIDARVVFIGEAPGQKEDELKRPFVGRAGQLLNKLLEEVGWRRDEVYITNIVKRRPPDNRDPLPDEIAAYKPYLTRQLAVLKPKVVVTLGRFSMNYFIPEGKITRDQGKVFRAAGLFIVPMFHPAAALRAPQVLEQLRASFKRLPAIIKKCSEIESEYIAKEKKKAKEVSGEEQSAKSLF